MPSTIFVLLRQHGRRPGHAVSNGAMSHVPAGLICHLCAWAAASGTAPDVNGSDHDHVFVPVHPILIATSRQRGNSEGLAVVCRHKLDVVPLWILPGIIVGVDTRSQLV